MLNRDTVIIIILCNTGVLIINFFTVVIALTRQADIARLLLERLNKIMAEQADQKAALDAGLSELKTAVVGVGDRVTKKLDELAANNPDITSEIQEIKDDVAQLNTIAADAPADTAPTDTAETPA